MARPDVFRIRTKAILPNASSTAPQIPRWNLAKLALGSVIMLSAFTCAAISLAWARRPETSYDSSFFSPLYGIFYPFFSLLWQSAEFYHAARNNEITGFSAASHLICDLLLGVTGLVLTIILLVFSWGDIMSMEDLVKNYDDVIIETLGYCYCPPVHFYIWFSTAFIWCGFALIAAFSHFTISIRSYCEIRQRYKDLETQSRSTRDTAPTYAEPSSKPLLTPAQPATVHQSPCEVLANETPQEFADSSRAVEMPGVLDHDICLSALSVGGTSRSNEQDSLQQDTLGGFTQLGPIMTEKTVSQSSQA